MSKRRKPSYIALPLACERVYPAGGRAILKIKTADELGAGELEERWKTRRAGRETAVSRRVLQLFVDRGGLIPVEDVVASFPHLPAAAVQQALVTLHEDDLIRIQNGHVHTAHSFPPPPPP